MGKYLKLFENHTQYETYINGSSAILPNVSLCATEGDVHYNPYVEPIETRLVAKFNVTDTSNPTKIGYKAFTSGFSEIEIDGVAQSSVVSAYTFSTTGEHTVKYTLTDPTSICTCAFMGCSGLTSIVIPSGVTSIDDGAFSGCTSLTRLNSDVDGVFNIPSGVTSIGIYAFDSCSGLTSIVIPSGVTIIDGWAFQHCSSLTSIVSNATTAPTIGSTTFLGAKTGGTLTVPQGSTGYNVWMGNGYYYLGIYNWTKVEQ